MISLQTTYTCTQKSNLSTMNNITFSVKITGKTPLISKSGLSNFKAMMNTFVEIACYRIEEFFSYQKHELEHFIPFSEIDKTTTIVLLFCFNSTYPITDYHEELKSAIQTLVKQNMPQMIYDTANIEVEIHKELLLLW
jgi:hypothetical protein